MKKINKKIIVITGVTGGVGAEAAKFFIQKDWIVVGLGRNSKKLERLSKEINNESFYYFITDVSEYKSVKLSFDKIKKNFGKVNVLVNNAALFSSKSFKKFKEKEINDIIDVNLKGTIFSTLECLKVMKSGRIINIGSVSGTHGIPNQTIYSASKYGVNGFAESLNQELIKDNIKISTILPGGIDTPLWNNDNVYHGDKSKILKPSDVVDAINYIINLSDNVVLKNMIMFPACEWH
jgi:NADP-dependent 3-hydroxy acid dehydrogenase YdfG